MLEIEEYKMNLEGAIKAPFLFLKYYVLHNTE
jgi:hypothetical protein